MNKQTLRRRAIQPGSHRRLRAWTSKNTRGFSDGLPRSGGTASAPYAGQTYGARCQNSGRSRTWTQAWFSGLRGLGGRPSADESRCCSFTARTVATSSRSTPWRQESGCFLARNRFRRRARGKHNGYRVAAENRRMGCPECPSSGKHGACACSDRRTPRQRRTLQAGSRGLGSHAGAVRGSL